MTFYLRLCAQNFLHQIDVESSYDVFWFLQKISWFPGQHRSLLRVSFRLPTKVTSSSPASSDIKLITPPHTLKCFTGSQKIPGAPNEGPGGGRRRKIPESRDRRPRAKGVVMTTYRRSSRQHRHTSASHWNIVK
jgi:hypothetical protein